MGKSSKKSATKVDAAPAVVSPSKSVTKGKRQPEDEIKQLGAKKQKIEEVAQEQKVEAMVQSKESSLDDSSPVSEDQKPVVKAVTPPKEQPVAVEPKVQKESSSDDSSSKAEDEKPAAESQPDKNVQPALSSSDESLDDGTDEDEAPEPNVTAVENGSAPSKKIDQSSESFEGSDKDNATEAAKKLPATAVKNAESDSISNGSDADDPMNDSNESSDDNPESSEEENEKKPSNIPQKSDKDVEMVDASSKKKAPKTPSTPKAENDGQKTLFVGNLSYSVQRSDVENFFKDCGEIVGVRLTVDEDGRFKGFGHVEFATSEAAKTALELHNQELLNRPVRLDLARERTTYAPNSGPNSGSQTGGKGQSQTGGKGQAQTGGKGQSQTGGKGPSQTVFVKGFDKSLGEEEIKFFLEEHFGKCGQITRVSVPQDYDTGESKGFAYLDFKDGESKNKALELNEANLGGYTLSVDEAKPREDRSSNRGGRFGGRSGGRGGRFGGRDRGGRFGGGRDKGGRFGGGRGSGGRGRGRGGRGGPNRPNNAAEGKKTNSGGDE